MLIGAPARVKLKPDASRGSARAIGQALVANEVPVTVGAEAKALDEGRTVRLGTTDGFAVYV
jgi:hypothetical protein